MFQQAVPASAEIPQLQGPVIAPGEVLERTFPVVRRQRALGWVESQFSVTNRRVLYRAKAKTFVGESISYREVNLADVNGLVLEGRRGFSASELVSLVVGFLIGLIALTFLSRVVTFGVLDLPAWMVLLYLAWILGGIGLFVIRLRAVEIVLAITAKGSDVTPVHMVGSSALLGASFLAGLLSPLALILEALGMYESDQAGNSATLLGGEQIYEEMGPLILALQDAQAGSGHGGA